MYRAGYSKLFWAMIFIVFDFNLGIINILPNFVGYILFYSGLNILSEQHKTFARGKTPAVILTLLTIKNVIKIQSNSPTGILGMSGIASMLIGSVVIILTIYLIYIACRGIYLVAEEMGIDELKSKVRAYWWFYFIISSIMMFYPPFSINLPRNHPGFVTLGIIINIIASLAIADMFRMAKADLGGPEEDESARHSQ